MLPKIARGEGGFSLIEVLVAVALLGIIAAAFLTGLFVTSKGVLLSDNLTTAEGLARTMMEEIKEGPFMAADDEEKQYYYYNAYYSESIPGEYEEMGYSITIAASTVQMQAGLQKITVTIFHNNVEILELEGYKRG